MIKIIAATMQDAIDVYLWRNDIHAKKMSVTTGQIELSAHLNWMKNILSDSNVKVYIGIENQIKIGVSRFTFNENDGNSEVSINLNPIMRNKGLSSVFLNKSMDQYFLNKKIDLSAKIKKVNVASIKCFQNSGFNIYGENKEFYYLIYRIKK